MADPSQKRILGRLVVSSCMLVSGCRVWFLMCRPKVCTLNRWSLGWGWLGCCKLFLPPASFLFPLWLHASLPWTYDWLFLLMSASCLSLRTPAAMTDGWFLPVQAISSASLCNPFLERHNHVFLLGACMYMDLNSHITAWAEQGKRLDPERWKTTLKMHLNTTFIAVWEKAESWNLAVAGKVQPTLLL